MRRYRIEEEMIELNVGGKYFTTYKSTLLSQMTEGSMLSAMFSGRFPLKKDTTGRYFIDRPSEPFEWILDTLRTGEYVTPASLSFKQKLCLEIEFYGLEHKLFQRVFPPSIDSVILEDGHDELLNKWIEKEYAFTLLYRASKHGMSAAEFHKRCDHSSPTIIIVKSSSGYIFGGYTECSWDSSGSYKNGDNSWLFSLRCPTGHQVKLKPNSTTNHIYCYSSYGPTFGGGHDLLINGSSCSFNPTTYPVPTNGNFFVGSLSCNIAEIEVFRLG